MHFPECFGTCPGVAPLLLGPFYCECRQVRAAGRIPPRDTQQHSVLGYGALAIVVVVMGYQLYQDRKQPEGMRIDLGPNGVKIEKK
jgi:hypothetical protein